MKIALRKAHGSAPVKRLTPIWSSGRPNRYLGTMCAPRREARIVFSATKLDSTAMSIALLPIPSTTTRLPLNGSLSM